MAKEAKEVKVLGMPVVVETAQNKEGQTEIHMTVGKKEFNEFQETKGITAEMRKLSEAVTTEVIEAGIKTIGDAVCDAKAAGGGTIKFGTGNGALTLKFVPVDTVRVPKTGEERTVYGHVSVKKTQKVPTSLEADGGILQQMEAKAAKVFGGKK